MRSVLGVVDRAPNYVDFMIRVDPAVSKYRLSVACSINDAYDLTGGAPGTNGVVGVNAPFLIPLEFLSGTLTRSQLIQKRGVGYLDESTRGQTRIILDISEWYGPANPSVPADTQHMFIRVEEFHRATNAWAPPGPIHIVPPANFYGNIPAGLTLAGTAPNTGGQAGRILSDQAMWISLPRYCATSNLSNRDNNVDLLVAWDWDQTSGAIEPNSSLGLTSTSFKNLVLEGAGGAPAWTAFFSIVHNL